MKKEEKPCEICHQKTTDLIVCKSCGRNYCKRCQSPSTNQQFCKECVSMQGIVSKI
jgi:hypothetical protein